MKTWFISRRKKPTDPKASTPIALTNNTSRFIRKTTSISSFHSALSELGVGPGPSGVAENIPLQPLNQATATKPMSTIPASPTGVVPNQTTIQTLLISSLPVPLFTKGDLDWEGFILDSRLLDWMWSILTDTEHIIAVLQFIPEIIWHSGVEKLPSINVLYKSILSSFNFTKKLRVLIQSFKDRALAATKVLVHLKIQRKCLTGRKDSKKLDHLVRTSGSDDLIIEMAAGFGMTKTWFVISVSYILLHPDFSSAGLIYNCIQCSLSNPGEYLPSSKFLLLGRRNHGMEMRIVLLEDDVALLHNGESGELQLRGPMMFTKYYNYPTTTDQNFVKGDWFRTGDLSIIGEGELTLSGRIKDSITVSYGILQLERQSCLMVENYEPSGGKSSCAHADTHY